MAGNFKARSLKLETKYKSQCSRKSSISTAPMKLSRLNCTQLVKTGARGKMKNKKEPNIRKTIFVTFDTLNKPRG